MNASFWINHPDIVGCSCSYIYFHEFLHIFQVSLKIAQAGNLSICISCWSASIGTGCNRPWSASVARTLSVSQDKREYTHFDKWCRTNILLVFLNVISRSWSDPCAHVNAYSEVNSVRESSLTRLIIIPLVADAVHQTHWSRRIHTVYCSFKPDGQPQTVYLGKTPPQYMEPMYSVCRAQTIENNCHLWEGRFGNLILWILLKFGIARSYCSTVL